MKKIKTNLLLLLFVVFSTSMLLAQNNSLDTLDLDPVVVSATKNLDRTTNLPLNISVVNSKDLQKIVSNSIDEVLGYQSGVNVIRPFGIYSNSSSLSLNGMGENQARTLVLLDGIPINKSDNGGVNWNKINSNEVRQIEIVKNSSSTIYGGSAMGGIVNIITQKPNKTGIHGNFDAFYGTNNIMGGNLDLNGRKSENKGLYWSILGKAKTSDGYILQPDSLQSPDVKYINAYMQEISFNFVTGYDFDENNSIEIKYNYYDDERGFGEKIEAEKGIYAEHDTHSANIKYIGQKSDNKWFANFYFQQEDYFKNIEKLSKGNYDLIFVDSKRVDFGNNTQFTTNFIPCNSLSLGTNIKQGSVVAIDDYQTSTDKVKNQGLLTQLEFYLQDKINLNKNIFGLLGVQYNISNISEAAFFIEEPTETTNFMQDFAGELENNNWSKLSYNAGFRYNLKNFGIYTSYNLGYRSPTLDNLTRSGFMYLGFKQANLNLKPEWIDNYNFGLNFINKKFLFNTSAYYNLGHDFISYMETGEILFGGKRKVVTTENISEVLIFGVNTDMKYNINKNISIFANHSFNRSEILENNENTNIVGKRLTYSPEHIVNGGVTFYSKYINCSLNTRYKTEQFTSDLNDEKIDAFYTIDTKLWININKHLIISVSAQNILDNQYLVYYNQLSVGRFMVGKISYKW